MKYNIESLSYRKGNEDVAFSYFREADSAVLILSGDVEGAKAKLTGNGHPFKCVHTEKGLEVSLALDKALPHKSYGPLFQLMEGVISELQISIPVEMTPDIVRAGHSGIKGGFQADLTLQPFPGRDASPGMREYGVKVMNQILGNNEATYASILVIAGAPNLSQSEAMGQKADLLRETSRKLNDNTAGISFDLSEGRGR